MRDCFFLKTLFKFWKSLQHATYYLWGGKFVAFLKKTLLWTSVKIKFHNIIFLLLFSKQ